MSQRKVNEAILKRRRAIDDLRVTISEAEAKILAGCKGMDKGGVEALKRRLKSCRVRLQQLLAVKDYSQEQGYLFKTSKKKVGRKS